MSTEGSPGFIRKFSKENSKEERDALAAKIRGDRAEYFDTTEQHNEAVEKLNEVRAKLDEYNSSNFLTKIKDYFKMRAAREKLGLASAQKEELDESLEGKSVNQGKAEIGSFYEQEKQRWANTPYGSEDIARQFTQEHLASLSIKDYALLMKRFPSEMVTHVTRQGIRDHTGMWEHSSGEGRFQTGFEKMLDDGSLKSPLAIRLAERGKVDTVMDILKDNRGEVPQDRAEAYKRLDSYFTNAGRSGFSDAAAIHVAAEEVADAYYGSEKGNEIFVAYPSAYIGSKYHFSNSSIGVDHGNDKYNDAWVLSEEEEGLSLNAGLVFIPKNARVDPETGSRYALGPSKEPIRNEAGYEGLARLSVSPELPEYAEQIKEILTRYNDPLLPPVGSWDEELRKPEHEAYVYRKALEELLPLRDKIMALSGISDERILGRVFDYHNISDIAGEGHRAYAIEQIMEKSGSKYTEAEHTQSSEEYWNSYFAAHPDKKPAKIIFYEEGSPTAAMNAWRNRNGVTKKASEPQSAFGGQLVYTEQLQTVQQRADRFQELAREVIDSHFPEEAPAAAYATVDDAMDDELPPPLPADEPFTI